MVPRMGRRTFGRGFELAAKANRYAFTRTVGGATLTRMDEIEELKQSLGHAAELYDDGQLCHVSQELDFAAQFLLDLYALNARGKSVTCNIRPQLTDSASAVR